MNYQEMANMKLIITNEAWSAPGVVVVDHFTMAHIVQFLRSEGIEIPGDVTMPDPTCPRCGEPYEGECGPCSVGLCQG